jgi:hypothetical protein
MDPRESDSAPFAPSPSLEANALVADRQALERERAALRIQAAAVAAQQAALTEQEQRLFHQQKSFDTQQEQLSEHLETRRQKLLDLQQRIQAARDELRTEQAALRQLAQDSRAQFEHTQSELNQAIQQENAERQRLLALRRRMKQRWHRQWAGEKLRLQNQEQALADRNAAVNLQFAEIKRERAALVEERMCLNGESELARRKTREAWSELLQAKRDWQPLVRKDREELTEISANLNRIRADLARAECDFDAKKRATEQSREQLAKEADGLERRISHLRRKLLDQEQEGRRLEAVLSELRARTGLTPSSQTATLAFPAAVHAPNRVNVLVPFAVPALVDQGRRAALEVIATNLSDARLHLVEQCLRLLSAWHLWHQDHEAATVELAAAGAKLTEREESVAQRERALVPLESDLRRVHAEIVQSRQRYESWQARLQMSEAALRAERETLLANVRGRETHADRQTAMIAELRQHWAQQRRAELETLRAERERCLEAQRRAAELCADYTRRNQDLEREARAMSVKSLSLEEYRLHFIATAENASATERRLVRLRQRWDKRFDAAERKLARDSAALSAAMIRLEKQVTSIRQLNEDVAGREEALERNRAAWEEDQAQAEISRSKLESELMSLRLHREVLQRQVGEERAEIERIMQVLLEEAPPSAPSILRAA